MPSKPFTVGQKSFYPDTSTLSYCLKEHNHFSQHVRLRRVIEDFARNGNLVLSHMQIMEIADNPYKPLRDGLGVWLNKLPIVWIKGTEIIETLEREYVVKHYFDPSTPKPEVFHQSFHESFEVYGVKLSAYSNIAEAITALHGEAGNKPRQSVAELGKNWSYRMWADQKHVEHNKVLKDEYLQITYAKHLKAFEESFLKDFLRLTVRNEVRVGGIFNPKVKRTAPRFLHKINDIISLMPSYFLTISAQLESRYRISKLRPGSNKFNAGSKSDLYDWWHLAGAAYCDVFTCDKRTIEDAASALMKMPSPSPILYENDENDFIDRLNAALG